MEYVEFARFIGGFVVVLALIGVMALILRNPRIQKHLMGQTTMKNGRLQVVESFYLDAKRRLVLVRRDDKEHLLLLTATGDMTIETGIKTVHDDAPPHTAA